jgi:hypothetical protein
MDTSENTCAICMGELADEPSHTLGCEHTFHTDCILAWAQSDSEQHGSCPVCRASSHVEIEGTRNPFLPYWQKAKFDRANRVVRAAQAHMNAAEQQVYDILQRDVSRTQGRLDEALARERDFKRQHKDIFVRHGQLERATRHARNNVFTARRSVLLQFPVTNIVTYREAGPRRPPTTSVLRRSDRIARRDEAAE